MFPSVEAIRWNKDHAPMVLTCIRLRTTPVGRIGYDRLDGFLERDPKNWIGRSEGAEVRFKVKDSDREFTIFTTRADTMFGVTFMVLAPESELVQQLTTADQKRK